MNTLEENFEVKGFDDDDVHRIISLVDKYQAIVIRVFNNINICRHNDIISLRDYESINESLNEIINALSMASPFSVEEKQVLLECQNINARKNKIAEILSTYNFDNFNNTTLQ